MGTRLSIPGPVGKLEAELSGPGSAIPSGAEPAQLAFQQLALLCHPHPRFGGSMHDMVLDVLVRVLAEHGIASLRFNFRGVGASDGVHSNGGGELDDLLAVMDWVASTWPQVTLLLGGYSFGAAIACRAQPALASAAGSDQAVRRLLLIAPPAGNFGGPAPDGSIATDVFVGDNDQFADLGELTAWPGARVHVLEDSDHFFSGGLEELALTIRQALSDLEQD